MFNDAFLVDEHAAHTQREQAAAASRSHQARLAAQVERCAAVPPTLVQRLTAAFRPASSAGTCD